MLMFNRKIVYLDNGATTMVDPNVAKKVLVYMTEKYGNASSLHQKGQEAKIALEESRAIIAKSINAKPSEIIFTSGGSESDNLAIKGVAALHKKGHIITSVIEHPAVLETVKSLTEQGFDISILKVNNEGFIDIEQLKKEIRKDTILVSIMHANNEIGTIQNIELIGKICKEKNIVFHTDAVQSYTKIPIDVKKINVDLISLSGHKIHAPKGIGALFVKDEVKLKKLIEGGKHENKLRAGTENIPGIVGFAEAASLASNSHIKHMEKLRDKLIDGILKIENTRLNGSRTKRLCNNVNISFKHIEGEAIGGYLDAEGICSSTGSACSTKSLQPSHVLMALGLKEEEAHGSLRLTLSKFTTEQEIDFVLEKLPKIVEKLRRMSPFK
ncbi:MAG: cysteine desulfurase family protein [Candidatus Nanoarchaeia archaeon]|nr:cysteine desulfurase family protein [Candidatus Nanoarchaeia archaeon]